MRIPFRTGGRIMGNPAGVRAKKREKRRKKEDKRLAAKAPPPMPTATKK